MLNPSRLRVMRALKEDDERDDLLRVADGIKINDASRLGSFWKNSPLAPSQEGQVPVQFPTDEARAKGFNPPVQGQSFPNQMVIEGVNSGEIPVARGEDILSGTEDAASREAGGTLDTLLMLNAKARRDEIAATEMLPNFMEAISPKLIEDITVSDELQSYRNAIDAFASTLASSPTGQRLGNTEVARDLSTDRFSAGMLDSPEEIQLAREIREGAIDTLLGIPSPRWRPTAVREAMEMVEAGNHPERVIEYLDAHGIYGKYFDAFWPKDPRYALPRPPTSYGDPMAGMQEIRKDKNGNPIRVLDLGPVQ